MSSLVFFYQRDIMGLTRASAWLALCDLSDVKLLHYPRSLTLQQHL